MRVQRSIVSVAAVILAACSGESTGPLKLVPEVFPSASHAVLVSGDHVVLTTNSIWDKGIAEGWVKEDYSGAIARIRWNGQTPGGSGTSFQMDVVWSPSCLWGVPLGHGMCIGQHMEVTFYNSHSFGEHVLLIRKYVLHLN